MEKKKKIVIGVILILACIGIVIACVIYKNTRVDKFTSLRNRYALCIIKIDYNSFDDYIDEAYVDLDFPEEGRKASNGFVKYNDIINIEIEFKEEFNRQPVECKISQMRNIEDEIIKNIDYVKFQSGYKKFLDEEKDKPESFKDDDVKHMVNQEINVKYSCGTQEYILSTTTLHIKDIIGNKNDMYTYYYIDQQVINCKKVNNSFKESSTGTTESTATSDSSSSGNSSYSTKKNQSTTEKTTEKSHDPDDYDIDTYYEDYKDEFEDEDDAWDDFEDNEGWEDY